MVFEILNFIFFEIFFGFFRISLMAALNLCCFCFLLLCRNNLYP